MLPPPEFQLSAVDTIFCGADGTLFPSEEPAFDASVAVTNRCLEQLGAGRRFSASELRLIAAGRNFRATITDLVARQTRTEAQVAFRTVLDEWVIEENQAVTAHLADVLTPNSEVCSSLSRLGQRYRLTVVSSSALSRVRACLKQTGLHELLANGRRFSAEDSLAAPTSKPDPSIYEVAVRRLGVGSIQAIAVEDAPAGAESAVGAGLPTVGMLCFVPLPERAQRIQDLKDAGVMDILSSWSELERLLAPVGHTTALS